MATVRLTNNMRDRLRKAARDLFEKSLEDAQNMPIGDPLEVYNLMFGEYTDRIKALPTPFFRWSDKFTITSINGYKFHHDYAFTCGPKPFPAGRFVMDTIHNEYGHQICFDVIGDKWNDMLVLATARRNSIDEVLEKRIAFTNTLNNLLTAHITVNSALKEWPALRGLLPSEIVMLIDAPAEKRVKKEIKSNVDTDMLTGIVVANKLAR